MSKNRSSPENAGWWQPSAVNKDQAGLPTVEPEARAELADREVADRAVGRRVGVPELPDTSP
jgi:hypothetical protein